MKRRVLFFHDEFPSGGGERVTRDIAGSICSEYETYVAVCNRNEGEVSEVSLLELPNKKLNSIENADAIIEMIHSLSIDIFVLPGFLWNWLGYVKERVSCKFVYILHNMPLWEVVAKHERRKRTQGSLLKILEWYFIAYPQFVWFKTYEKKFIRKYREVYDLVDAYVVLCDAYGKELIELFDLSSQNKISVIHNAEKIVPQPNMHKKKQVLFVGNMIYENKRIDRLLDIWGMVYHKVPDWELIIVGGGREKENLLRKAKRMNLQNIIFVGGSTNVVPYYRDASVSCLTSTFEGWPLCLTEAQANGVVPIAFNCCAGVEEILSPSGVNGVLIPSFEKETFAEELYKLLTSPEQLEQIRKNVIQRSYDYSIEIIGKQWANLFNSLCSSNKIERI